MNSFGPLFFTFEYRLRVLNLRYHSYVQWKACLKLNYNYCWCLDFFHLWLRLIVCLSTFSLFSVSCYPWYWLEIYAVWRLNYSWLCLHLWSNFFEMRLNRFHSRKLKSFDPNKMFFASDCNFNSTLWMSSHMTQWYSALVTDSSYPHYDTTVSISAIGCQYCWMIRYTDSPLLHFISSLSLAACSYLLCEYWKSCSINFCAIFFWNSLSKIFR